MSLHLNKPLSIYVTQGLGSSLIFILKYFCGGGKNHVQEWKYVSVTDISLPMTKLAQDSAFMLKI